MLFKAALAERHLVMGKQIYDATSRYDDAVHWLDDLPATGVLQWPVMFLYPEYAQSDFIERFTESDTFAEQLESMFGPEAPPCEWDRAGTYKPERLAVYFETNVTDIVGQGTNYGARKWTRVPLEYTLLQALQMPDHVIPKIPVFHVFVAGSTFLLEFLRAHS